MLLDVALSYYKDVKIVKQKLVYKKLENNIIIIPTLIRIIAKILLNLNPQEKEEY